MLRAGGVCRLLEPGDWALGSCEGGHGWMSICLVVGGSFTYYYGFKKERQQRG